VKAIMRSESTVEVPSTLQLVSSFKLQWPFTKYIRLPFYFLVLEYLAAEVLECSGILVQQEQVGYFLFLVNKLRKPLFHQFRNAELLHDTSCWQCEAMRN
jgi:hypothetical protein